MKKLTRKQLQRLIIESLNEQAVSDPIAEFKKSYDDAISKAKSDKAEIEKKLKEIKEELNEKIVELFPLVVDDTKNKLNPPFNDPDRYKEPLYAKTAINSHERKLESIGSEKDKLIFLKFIKDNIK